MDYFVGLDVSLRFAAVQSNLTKVTPIAVHDTTSGPIFGSVEQSVITAAAQWRR